MVHHIVMWKFKPEIEENKKEELKKAMEENLTALVGKIPGLLTLEFVACPFGSVGVGRKKRFLGTQISRLM